MLAQILHAFLGLAVETLLLVEQIGCAEPHVAKAVDVKVEMHLALLDEQTTLVARATDIGISDSCLFKNLLHLRAILVRHLYHDARILCKEELHKVVAFHLVQVDVESSLCIGEAHLQQASDETACRDVVTGKDEALLNQVLHGVEGIAEVLCITHRRHITADATETLGKGGTAKTQLIEREVYMI